MSAGSQTIYATGAAVLAAAADLKRKMLDWAAALLETPAEQLETNAEGIYARGSPESNVTYDRLYQLGSEWFATGAPLIGVGSAPKRQRAPGYAASVVRVAVDPDTGLVKLLGLTIAQDVGKAINPPLVEGQMRGGAAQSVGFGLWEEVLYTDQALVRNPGLLDYRLPTAADLPNIQTIIVEAPGGDGPYGAKIAGEPSIITPLAAIANAVRAATGVRPVALPLTPERVWRAMQMANQETSTS
jgi:CO/xanthine dehydrogenase Mo-binding subunit